ncbi:MAG TPA: arginase family protein, partial [Saprospiraceae bacterium]|nr:arginase family protein [Saprospiraceae bacterium]
MPFHQLKNAYKNTLINNRKGEKKLGDLLETSQKPADQTDWGDFPQKYVLLGLCEDIGVRANFGRPGASRAYHAFLKSFLNQQVNVSFNPQTLLLGGYYFRETEIEEAEMLRETVEAIDGEIASVVEAIVRAGKTPILIGGGHNNAYPAIKGVYKACRSKLSVVNFDAHTDCRDLEGRHSGNGFSYAHEKGFLESYWVVGLSEAYTSKSILEKLKNWPDAHLVSYDQ